MSFSQRRLLDNICIKARYILVNNNIKIKLWIQQVKDMLDDIQKAHTEWDFDNALYQWKQVLYAS